MRKQKFNQTNTCTYFPEKVKICFELCWGFSYSDKAMVEKTTIDSFYLTDFNFYVFHVSLKASLDRPVTTYSTLLLEDTPYFQLWSVHLMKYAS